jgi:isopenicillin-N epimerase
MVPVNLADVDADFYTANCHKWLMAPAGAGFLHVRAEARKLIEPLITSWGWEYDRANPDAASGWGGSRWQWDREFHGTSDRCPQMVLPEALDFRTELGGDAAIAARVRELSTYARERFASIGLACATPRNEQLSGAIVAFDFPCADVVAARDRLYHDFHIECPVTSAAGETFLRVSTAWFVTSEQIDALVRAVEAMKGVRS